MVYAVQRSLYVTHIRDMPKLLRCYRLMDALTSQTAVFLFQCKSDQFSDHNTGRKTADFGVKERKTCFSQTLAIPAFAAVVKGCCDCKRPTGSVGVSGSNPLCSTSPQVLRNQGLRFFLCSAIITVCRCCNIVYNIDSSYPQGKT